MSVACCACCPAWETAAGSGGKGNGGKTACLVPLLLLVWSEHTCECKQKDPMEELDYACIVYTEDWKV